MGLTEVKLWSDMPLTSGAKADHVPLLGVGTAIQPQPPGTQVATLEANWPSVPVSNPCSHRTEVGVTVDVGVPVIVLSVGVRVAVKVGESVNVGVSVAVV